MAERDGSEMVELTHFYVHFMVCMHVHSQTERNTHTHVPFIVPLKKGIKELQILKSEVEKILTVFREKAEFL